jgi:hypothetical protein
VNERARSVPLHRWLLASAIGLSFPAIPIGVATWINHWSNALLLVNLLAIAVLIIVGYQERLDHRREQRRQQSGEALRQLVLVAEDNRA